tara:strand:+ start:615 stop:1466 length:852 start_codon:yes stop_codon:yes gene_type:complete
VAQTLKDRGVIRSVTVFRGIAAVVGNPIKPGPYTIPKSVSWRRLFQVLNATPQVRLTIIPGMALPEIANALALADPRDPQAFIHYVHTQAKQDLAADFPWLRKTPSDTLEGYLFPDTYFIEPGMTHAQLVRLFITRLHTQLWQSNPRAHTNFHETLTLASIIEKESLHPDEFAKVSAVFHNRLNRNQRLESCPTVAYALGQYRKQQLTFDDLTVDSPYNTYRVSGLPPTPIAAVSAAAFYAALHPEPNFPFYYFVADGTGNHIFSKTYRAHLKHQKQLANRAL